MTARSKPDTKGIPFLPSTHKLFPRRELHGATFRDAEFLRRNLSGCAVVGFG